MRLRTPESWLGAGACPRNLVASRKRPLAHSLNFTSIYSIPLPFAAEPKEDPRESLVGCSKWTAKREPYGVQNYDARSYLNVTPMRKATK